MKSSVKTNVDKSWALPGDSISQEEFQRKIQEIEKGSFYTIDEAKKKLASWRDSKNFLLSYQTSLSMK